MAENTMMAAVIHEHGGPECMKIETVARPQPKADEVVLRVAACTIGHLDVFVRNGMPGREIPLPHITGCDVAGWVEQLGADVTGLQVGDAVLVDPTVPGGTLGEVIPGGLAQYVAVPADNLLALDADDIDTFVKAAALPIAYGTAHRMLFDRGGVKAGETLVVLGASGGVGVSCVQLGKQAGARVIAVTSSDWKAEQLRGIGADVAIVMKNGEFGKQVWQATDKQGADAVVDFTGKVTWPQSLRAVKHGGRLLTCGATTGFDAVTDLRYVWVREIDIRGSDAWTRDSLRKLTQLTMDGDLDPVIHAVVALSNVDRAFEELDQRRAFGKVVVLPDDVFASYEHPAKIN